MSKHILIVVANPDVSTTLGWPVGFWAAELTHPYHAFINEGYKVTIASPKGGKVELDSLSDPRDESGYSAWDELSLQYLQDPNFVQLLENTPSLSNFDIDDFDAIVVAGGQSPMFSFEQATNLHEFFSDFYATGKTSAALCHGTAVLRWATENGSPLVNGKKVTGFSNPEEDEADKAVGQKVMPWRIQDSLTGLGANFVHGELWEAYAVQDGNLITGQQQMSGGEVAKLVIQNLENA